MNSPPPLFKHQEEDVQTYLANDYIFNTNEPGTGKTRTNLEAFARRARRGDAKRALVLAPKSILEAAWAADIEKYAPGAKYGIAWASNREAPFKNNADIVLINHDGVNWLKDNPKHLDGFTDLYGDESTAYKHPTAARSKAAKKLAPRFNFRVMCTGTPTSISVTDLWHQVLLLDGGEHLGKSFWRFRSECCWRDLEKGFPVWRDKEGINDLIASLIEPFTLNRKLEDCVSIPANHTYNIDFTLTPVLRDAYEEMRKTAILELQNSYVTAVHKAALTNKLLQIASGAVYSGEGQYEVIDTARYELILDLVESRAQSVVAFTWRHQREELLRQAAKRKLPVGVIDGSVNVTARNTAVQRFQNGELRALLLHPQSAAHGLTLTAGRSTIWASPTTVPEWFEQLNRRIYRAGQQHKTETIMIEATNTIEPLRYQQLHDRVNRALDLRDLLHTATKDRAA